MKHIEIEYNRELKPLEAILSDVKHPGEFFVAGAMEIPMPRVEVKGVGALSFPIPRPQIETLVQHAMRAPYGRGEETIIDASVRNVWQIDSASVKISGKSWAASVGSIISKATAGLGCSDATVSAELYKMLAYDRGGFFLAHRDTEKTAGMFGTLVLTLPSFHRGGALRLRHAEREVTIESDANEPSEISFAAFYSDCEHEVMPVREGVRVCLVYNLIQDRTKSRHRILKTPHYESQVAEAALVLDGFWSSPQAPPKIVWLLDHQYSPAGLSFSSLKGADAARARVLLQAADRAQCVAHLGVVHIGETGAAEWDGGYNFYDDDNEQDDGGEGEDDDFTAITVDDSWQYLDEWRDRDDRAAAFGRIPLTRGELIPAGALDKEPPDEKRLTEASGNEGATYERSYHRAALVLWPANRMADVLLKGGVAAAIPYLKQLIARGESARAEANAVARRIVKAWPADAQRPDRYSMGITAAGSSDRAGMILGLVEMKAAVLLEHFIRDTVIPTYDGTENPSLIASLSVLGIANASVVLSALVETRMPDHPTECIELLLNLTADLSRSFEQVAEAVVAGLDRITVQNSEPDAFRQLRVLTAGLQRQRGLAPEFLVNLFSALRPFKGQLFIAAAEKIGSRPDVFPPTSLVVPAIERICRDWGDVPPAVDRALRHLWTSAAQFLLLHSEVPPQPPSDWSLPAKLSCTCADCRELQGFARDPVARVHRFRVRKERRRHLHQVIDGHALDMTHLTERAGSPQTLVCTKDRRTFNERMKEYQGEIAAMRTLLKLTPETAVAGRLQKRIEAAIEVSRI